MTTARISTWLQIFLWVCAGLWLGSGVVSFFAFDRNLVYAIGMLVMSGPVIGLAAAVLWVLDRRAQSAEVAPGEAVLTGLDGRDKPKGSLVLSSKTETASPAVAGQGSAEPLPANEMTASTTAGTPLLSEPPAKRWSSIVAAAAPALVFLAVLLSPFGYIWYQVGTKVFLTFLGILLAIGLPIFLLSLFETGRKILKGLFAFLQLLFVGLQVITVILDLVSGGSKGSGGDFAGGSGGFGGGGASGKW